MITEDYVSFETAKLLKEKGFDKKCQKVYMHNGQLLWAQIFMEDESFVNNKDIDLVANYNDWNTHTKGEYAYLCPTLQMTMKWLREIYEIDIIIFRHIRGKRTTFYDRIEKRTHLEHQSKCNLYFSYEEACEAAIKYCLENLINKKEGNT